MKIEFGTVIKSKEDSKYIDKISFTFPFEIVCSIPMKPFGGTITVTYRPDLKQQEIKLIEWNSLAYWFEHSRSISLTAEQLGNVLLSNIIKKIDPSYIHIAINVTSKFHLPATIEYQYHKEEHIIENH